MFMPSARIHKEMQYEPAGFWPVPINKGDEYALLVKAPTNVIKAAYRSAPVKLLVATATTPSGTVMGTVFSVADDPKAPLGISGIQRHAEEQEALKAILCQEKALIVFFDELSRAVLRGQCTLASADCQSLLHQWESVSDWYVGAWGPPLPEVLDEVDAIADPTLTAAIKFSPTVKEIVLTVTDFEVGKITMIGTNEVRDFSLDCPDEGYGLEQSTWHLLENLFAPNIFHSPHVQENSGTRELTDIFGFCEAGDCLIEAKAIAVLSTAMDRSTDRRTRNIRKQIDKGLAQLPGAIRNLTTGAALVTKSNQPIVVPKRDRPIRIGVIMVSELLPAVDWQSVASQLITAASSASAILLVLDLQELRLLVGISKSPEIFLAQLVRRFDIMTEKGSALIRSKLEGPPLP